MREWSIVKWSVSISILVFVVVFIIHGITEEATRINMRFSARIAALLFSLAFMASSLQYFFKGEATFWVLANRKFFGISFAIIHLIHLALIGFLHFKYHPIFFIAKTSSLLSGGLAFLFIALMLLTSFKKFSSLISKKTWKVLHTLGGYWIWLIFMISYMKRVDTEIEYLPLVVILLVAFILRISKQIHSFNN